MFMSRVGWGVLSGLVDKGPPATSVVVLEAMLDPAMGQFHIGERACEPIGGRRGG